MKTKTQTKESADPKTPMTALQATQELLATADLVAKRYEKAKGKLINDVATNPVDAIAWGGEEMTKVQTEHEFWLRIKADLASHAPVDVLAEAINECNRAVRRFLGSNSTSLFHNAVERAKAETCNRMAEEFERTRNYFIRKMGAAVEPRRCGNCGTIVAVGETKCIRCDAPLA